MTLKVRLTEEQAARYEAAAVFWESYAAWEKCSGDEGKKAASLLDTSPAGSAMHGRRCRAITSLL